MKSIPIAAAKRIAKQYGYDQVVIIARKVGEIGEEHGEHCTTYGVDQAHCVVAARIGDFLKFKVMGWVKEQWASGGIAVLTAEESSAPCRNGKASRNNTLKEKIMCDTAKDELRTFRNPAGQAINLQGIAGSERPRLDLDDIFRYHAPSPEDLARYTMLRSAAKHFAQVVLDCTPPCADQTAAIRKIREAVMTANAAIALRGAV